MASADASTTFVIGAALEIPFGQKIQANHLKIMEWPKSAPLPAGAIQQFDEAEGRVTSQTIFAGEMVLSSRVVEHTTGSTLSAIIAPSKRAITLRVNDVVGVAGFLLPGNRIDVLASRKLGKRVSTRTLLEDLKVLAVDQTASPEKDKPIVVRAVTIEAEPKQAEKLFKEEHWAEARAAYDRARDLESNWGSPRVRLAVEGAVACSLKLKLWDDAISRAEQFVAGRVVVDMVHGEDERVEPFPGEPKFNGVKDGIGHLVLLAAS